MLRPFNLLDASNNIKNLYSTTLPYIFPKYTLKLHPDISLWPVATAH